MSIGASGPLGAVRSSYDAIVVGGGPAGATAAYHLAAGGADVLLVEKSAYPREKVCGDGLTPRAVAAMDRMGLGHVYGGWSRNFGLRIHGAGLALELPWPQLAGFPSFGLSRPRLDFDLLLAGQAAARGAQVLQSTDAVAPLIERGLVTGMILQPKDEDVVDVRSPVVIAADGPSSRVAQALGLNRDERRPIGVAVRQYFRTDRDSDDWLDSYLELWRGDDQLPGYGWVFPMCDGTVNVGLGLLNTSKHFAHVNYRQLLASWVPTAGADWGFTAGDAVAKPKSGPLPMGANRHPCLHRGVLFIGDAAGLVNPFNGEGIAYAMETGELAAETALASLAAADRSALARYPEAVRDRYGSYFTLGRTFVRLIGDPRVMKLATRYGLPHPRAMRLVLKLLGNLFEPTGGDAADRIVQALTRLAPAR